MARVLTPKDAHALMNLLVKQATGQSDIAVVDSSSFVSAGEKVLATGTENVINSLSLIIGRTLMATRPYKAKLATINALNSGVYTNRLRKISFYSKDAQASGAYNTDLYTNLAMGFNNGKNPDSEGAARSTASMWEQNAPVALEMNFGGTSTWQDSYTVYDSQLQAAFRDEASFNQFVSGILTERGNDIESQKEAFNRMTILNHIAGIYDMSTSMKGSVVNLTAEFNAETNNTYTTAEILEEHRAEFLKFFTAKFKLVSDYMTNRTAKYHWSPSKQVDGVDYTLLRHTPKDKQKTLLYAPFFTEAKANVFPEIFNPQYLMEGNGEMVDYWQSIDMPSAINVTPAIPDDTTGLQKAGATVSIPYVLGIIFDEDAMMIDYQLEDAISTPMEARKRYRNVWWTFAKNAINDFTENAVIFIMKDED